MLRGWVWFVRDALHPQSRTSPEFSPSIAESIAGVIPAVPSQGSRALEGFGPSIAESIAGVIPAVPSQGSRALEGFGPSLCAPIARGTGRTQPVGLPFALGLCREEQPGQPELPQDFAASSSLSWLRIPQDEGGRRVGFGDLQN